MEQPRPRCDGCGRNLEPWEEDLVIYDCFHAVHAACATQSGACPRCGTPPDDGAGAGGAAPSSHSPPPGSSVAGATSSNDGGGGADYDDVDGCPYSRAVVACDDCGGLSSFSDRERFWNGNCPYCIIHGLNPRRLKWNVSTSPGAEGRLGSPDWSSSSFGSPELSPPPEQFAQTPAATANPSAPAQPSDTVPFGHPPPPPPENTFQPPPPPAQFGPPPALFQHYSHHAGQFGPPPSFAPPLPPQHPRIGQFGCPPASSQPSERVPFRQPPPLAFGNPYFSNFAPVGPPPPAQHYGTSMIPPPPQPVTTSSFTPMFRPMHQPFPSPPPPYPAFQTSAFENQYQQQPPAAVSLAYAPPAAGPPSCAACGGGVVRGQTAVTSQCGHTFHFLCFTGSAHACPACGAQWRDVGLVIPPPLPPSYRY
ncbi:unnamed protein product [Urochloa humidicola]